jgi:hypothetical protein
MNNLSQWALKWGVPFEAVQDLRQQFGTATDPARAPTIGRSEAAVQNLVRLEASRNGGRMWRNNRGACYDEHGNFIRYGLANDSKQLDKIIKSSDLIGVKPVAITPAHIGQTLGVFVSREVKPADWRYTGTPRERAQLAWLELIASLGGDAAFASGEGTL